MLTRAQAVRVFLVFATGYFLSALIRAITATLAPTLSAEFALSAADLGLLAGGYFLGFAATQLPLGVWLDRFGPKRVILALLTLAALACVAFAMATHYAALLAARVLSGVGVSACLMAPLTAYRRWFAPGAQLRANSWMLMTGSLGMLASTLPVQWLLPVMGWRGVFWLLAVVVLLCMALIATLVPTWERTEIAPGAGQSGGYAMIWRHPTFRTLVPIGFFSYGGLVAVQTLWAAPWMNRVAGYDPTRTAAAMFWLNFCMLVTFWTWGAINPWLQRRGLSPDTIISRGLPMSFVVLAIIIVAGPAGADWAGVLWTLYCVSCTCIALAQPAVGMAFPAELAGRALSAYNLVIFVGVFVVQWGIGLAIQGGLTLGWSQAQAFQVALAVFGIGSVLAYLHFLHARRHNAR